MTFHRRSAGILGIGQYLPSEVRTNDWWPSQVVERWRANAEAKVVSPDSDRQLSPSLRKTLQALDGLRADPFQGARERRVAPDGMTSSEMEVEAGCDALKAAGIAPGHVDGLITSSTTPDHLDVPNACRVHERLGLSPHCFSSTVDAMCNAFLTELCLAEQLIAGDQARYVLLIQSSLMSRLTTTEEQQSAWYGDGATAVLIGPVGEGRGVLGRAHTTDGSVFGGVVCGIPGRSWWDEGRIRAYVRDAERARKMVLGTAEIGRDVVNRALIQANVQREEIAFYGSHQAWAWFRPVTQDVLGLNHCKYVDTFPKYASLLGANIPMGLLEGADSGKLKAGDLVAMYSGAAGLTASGVILRWGT